MERIAKEGNGIIKMKDDSDDEIEELKYCINKLKGAGFLFI